MEIILTFVSTNYAIKAERILLQSNIETRVMPLPSCIRAGCGLCLRIAPSDGGNAETALAQNDVPIEGFYQKNGNSYLPYESGKYNG